MDVFKLTTKNNIKSGLGSYKTICDIPDIDFSNMSLGDLLHLVFFQKLSDSKDENNLIKVTKLLEQLPKLYLMNKVDISELVEIGLTKYQAYVFKASLEIGKRFIKESRKPLTKVTNSYDVYYYMESHMKNLEKELFVVLFLDSQNQIIKDIEISQGSVKDVNIDVNKIVEVAIRYRASFLIFVHNHPSGSSSPSYQDKQFTRKLVSYGEIINIRILDHIIIGSAEYFSFLDEGLIKRYQKDYNDFYENNVN